MYVVAETHFWNPSADGAAFFDSFDGWPSHFYGNLYFLIDTAFQVIENVFLSSLNNWKWGAVAYFKFSIGLLTMTKRNGQVMTRRPTTIDEARSTQTQIVVAAHPNMLLN